MVIFSETLLMKAIYKGLKYPHLNASNYMFDYKCFSIVITDQIILKLPARDNDNKIWALHDIV